MNRLKFRLRKLYVVTLLANAVLAKREDGNIGAAIQITCCKDKPVLNSDEVYAMLLEKHPSTNSSH